MKTLFSISIFTLLVIACQQPCPEQNTEADKEIERLKIKLEATEAQLINVSAELSKLKSDSSKSAATY